MLYMGDSRTGELAHISIIPHSATVSIQVCHVAGSQFSGEDMILSPNTIALGFNSGAVAGWRRPRHCGVCDFPQGETNHPACESVG